MYILWPSEIYPRNSSLTKHIIKQYNTSQSWNKGQKTIIPKIMDKVHYPFMRKTLDKQE